ncbi:MAG: HPP family protein [Oleiphilus sp.]
MKIKDIMAYFVPEPVSLSGSEQIRSVFAAFMATLLLMLISWYSLEDEAVPLMLASMGASVVILFAAYSSPLAQPWSFVGSHFLAAFIGVSCSRWIEPLWLAGAASVSITLFAMLRLHCLHPPGGATALVPVLGGDAVHELGYQILLMPVLLNVLVLLFLSWGINSCLKRRYPYKSKPLPGESAQKLFDDKAIERAGVSELDVRGALNQFDTYLDISENDLNKIYRIAEANSRQRDRLSPFCRDLMSRDLVTVKPNTSQARAWKLLEKHKLKVIPVVDGRQRLKGIVTLVDFLKLSGIRPVNMEAAKSARGRAINRLRQMTLGTGKTNILVKDIMSQNALTARKDQRLLELIPEVCDAELHHLPVVDDQHRLVGIITATDLLAALYQYGKKL